MKKYIFIYKASSYRIIVSITAENEVKARIELTLLVKDNSLFTLSNPD